MKIQSEVQKQEKIDKITNKTYGRITRMNNEGGYILKNKAKEITKTGKQVYSDSLIVSDNSTLEISNKNTTCVLFPESSVYIDDERISLKKGSVKINGKVKMLVNGFFIYGEGDVIVKMKNDNIQVAVYDGEVYVSKEGKKVKIIKNEGTLLSKDGIEEPFKLPENTEIKVRIY